MTKLQFLIWAPTGMPITAFSELVERELLPRLMEHDPQQLKLTLTKENPPKIAVIPYQRRGLALISLWEVEEEKFSQWAELIQSAGAILGERVAGYQMTEALPLNYDREWPDGEQTPGMGLLTLLRRKRGMDDKDFFHRWHGVHTPLTVRTHPNWTYVRNVVGESLIEGSPDLDGIVEEHFRERADLVNPALFFGGPWSSDRPALKRLAKMVPNMIKVGLDVAGFLDMKTLETYFTGERWLKS